MGGWPRRIARHHNIVSCEVVCVCVVEMTAVEMSQYVRGDVEREIGPATMTSVDGCLGACVRLLHGGSVCYVYTIPRR
jgi:hypothetical protein